MHTGPAWGISWSRTIRYPHRKGLASRLRCPVTGRDRDGREFEIDAVLNDVLQVVLFEEKAAWLKDEVVLGEIDVWIAQIRSRYGAAAALVDGKKERPKGVAQLAQHVRRILDRNCGGAQPDFAAVEVIYPVLLVHDTRLDAPAYGGAGLFGFQAIDGELVAVEVADIACIGVRPELARSDRAFVFAASGERCPVERRNRRSARGNKADRAAIGIGCRSAVGGHQYTEEFFGLFAPD
jgi:hypothetical protein